MELQEISDVDAALEIQRHHIHVLINLNGYTDGERNAIFALQPAPLAVMFKGFMGTLGSNYVNYYIF